MPFPLLGHVHFAHEHFLGSFDLHRLVLIEIELKLREVADVDGAVRLVFI